MTLIVSKEEAKFKADAVTPIFAEIAYQQPSILFKNFSDKKGSMLIISADYFLEAYGTNHYSYILVDPFYVYTFNQSVSVSYKRDPLNELVQLVKQYPLTSIEKLPPFQGGIAGHLSYDLAYLYHPIIPPQINDLNFPEVYMGFYDLICAFDHTNGKAYLFSSGFPEIESKKRQARAKKRLLWLRDCLTQSKVIHSEDQKTDNNISITSNFTKEEYLATVEKTIEYIGEGDIFEANLSQRFQAYLQKGYDYYALFKRVSAINPSPFSAYLNLGEHKILSSSPERFLKLQDQIVETRPIKGTRARVKDKRKDENNVRDLLSSEKDFAENIMIVDLMRNDLSIVCEDDSVTVPQLCGHEVYSTVHHLVSVILGKLRHDETAFTLLRATFPGGSITGAPKVRAMQIIAELEPHYRGPYCGSIALIGFDGNMDSSIVIRTYVAKDNFITFHAGGAVVIDSSPLEEYEETLSKSQALRIALQGDLSDFAN